MPATATHTPTIFSRDERLLAEASYLREKIKESKLSVQYSRQGVRWSPLVPTCSQLESDLALRAVRQHGLSFDDALRELRFGDR